jgi:hypothetical protein
MTQPALQDPVREVIAHAQAMAAAGHARAGIDLLTESNRVQRDERLEVALVWIRRAACRGIPAPAYVPREPLPGPSTASELVEVTAEALDYAVLRHGLTRGGCLLVRGLVAPERARSLAAGIDAALASYDAAEAGDAKQVDPAWYTPVSMPDQIPPDEIGAAVVGRPLAGRGVHMPERRRRKFIREDGGLWTAYSPRMLFDLMEVFEQSGVGRVAEEFLGARPFLAANKCTLRRTHPLPVCGGWHQDGAFLGVEVRAFNVWIALTKCGSDAPGLDIVAKRFEDVLVPGDGADFDWSLSNEAVSIAAAGAPIERPEFEAGDALLFDHLLVHRTASTPEMTRERHAIESWFFSPTAYPPGQLPLAF